MTWTDIVRREFKARGATPTFLGYHGYPATVCVSINDEIVHGIPGERVIREGDIVSLDLVGRPIAASWGTARSPSVRAK